MAIRRKPGRSHPIGAGIPRGRGRKRMFGGLVFMVNGRMCCGIIKNDLMLACGAVQTAEDAREAAYTRHGLHWTEIERDDLRIARGTSNGEGTRTWIGEGLEFV